MICPNCAREMVHITRHGVTLDRCEVCGGIWLDRGELEHLLETVRSPVVLPNPDPAPRPAAPARRPEPVRREPAREEYAPRKKGKRKAHKKKYSTKARLKYMLKELLD
jgi:Zn-finger nucleic acid-binding protein